MFLFLAVGTLILVEEGGVRSSPLRAPIWLLQQARTLSWRAAAKRLAFSFFLLLAFSFAISS
jgi:hypothetical protein